MHESKKDLVKDNKMDVSGLFRTLGVRCTKGNPVCCTKIIFFLLICFYHLCDRLCQKGDCPWFSGLMHSVVFFL